MSGNLNQEYLVRSVMDLVSKVGYTKITGRLVADECGTSPGKIYKVFRNIDDLMLAVNQEILASLRIKLDNAVSDSSTRQDILIRLGNAYMDFAIKSPRLWEMLACYRPITGTLPVWQDQSWTAFFCNLASVLHLKDGPEGVVTARIVFSALHGLVSLSMARSATYSSLQKEHLGIMASMLCLGMEASPSSS